MNRKTLKIILFILLLPAGIWLMQAIFHSSSTAGSGQGIGIFSHQFRYDLWYQNEGSNNECHFYIVGESPAKLTTNGKHVPHYQTAKLEWQVISKNNKLIDGNYIIDLDKKIIDTGTTKLPLDQQNLSTLLTLPPDYESTPQVSQSLLDILTDCHEGKLPPPRHHASDVPAPFQGSLQHFAHGPALRGPGIAWVIIWSILLIGWGLRRY